MGKKELCHINHNYILKYVRNNIKKKKKLEFSPYILNERFNIYISNDLYILTLWI